LPLMREIRTLCNLRLGNLMPAREFAGNKSFDDPPMMAERQNLRPQLCPRPDKQNMFSQILTGLLAATHFDMFRTSTTGDQQSSGTRRITNGQKVIFSCWSNGLVWLFVDLASGVVGVTGLFKRSTLIQMYRSKC
jgi:hypothetical protein